MFGGDGDMGGFGENFDPRFPGRFREEGYESRSGSDHLDGISGDDLDPLDENVQPSKRKKYNRHTPAQIQELEAFFKECPHPDETQRLELGRRLGLESKQIKFWFQNRRTQLKTQMERRENTLLRDDNNRLRSENHAMKTKLSQLICNNCGGPTIFGNSDALSMEEQQLRLENARLKAELAHICSLISKLPGKPPISNSAVSSPTSNLLEDLTVMSGLLPQGFSFQNGVLSMTPLARQACGLTGNNNNDAASNEKSGYMDLVMLAMSDLVRMAEVDSPLWSRSLDGTKEVFNHEEYKRIQSEWMDSIPSTHAIEATRETGMVLINSLAVVQTLMDVDKWKETFPCIISKASVSDVISAGSSGNWNGALQVIDAELQVISPLVPIRHVRFLRFCKQHADGVWVVVDVSPYVSKEASIKTLPSGCILQDMPNGCSKVTWIEHCQYEESQIPDLCRPLLRSGSGFGAQRWLSTLQRETESLAMFISATIPDENPSGISPSGRKSMLKLAKRMVQSFCSGVCSSDACEWDSLHIGSVGHDVRVMTRNCLNDPGGPSGIILSAAVSVWMPAAHEVLFTFLRDERMRCEWDILSHGEPMREMVHIANGPGRENCVSVLRANPIDGTENSMLILQETWTDPSGSLLVFAPVDTPSMNEVMNGGDSSFVALLPSGFSIIPAASPECDSMKNGSLLTVGFQILVSSFPATKLTSESVDTVNSLISLTIQKIKAALQLA